uniref:Uncharacterized protein n=1 Tax=Anguilla anguilla TaxID=7936 RepID=A0A0E9STD8_ANGAN
MPKTIALASAPNKTDSLNPANLRSNN